MDFVELFCGIGGFRLGLKRSGWKCKWANDNDRSACKIYHHRFGYKELIEADIQTVKTDSIPNHTLLTAGFPCQAFSVAGKRQGFQDTRGTLFYEICRVAEAKRPPLLLLENVKGLLSHDEGFTFQIILESLEELGYLCEWQVLNSKHFGVPQNRERVFIVGHLGGKGERTIFPIGISNQISKRKNAKTSRTQQRVSSTLHARYSSLQAQGETYIMQTVHKVGNIFPSEHEAGDVLDPNGISETLRPMGPRGSSKVQAPKIVQLVGDRDKPSISVKDEAFCLPSNPMSDRQQVVVEPKKEPYIQNIPHGYNEGWQKPFPNLRAEADSAHNELLVQNCRIRRLTPTECERLQGFPDGWTRGVSDTQRYKLLGNAVTVLVIEFLGRKLLEVSK